MNGIKTKTIILILDDDQDNIDAISEIINTQNSTIKYRIESAKSVEDALEIVKSKHPHLILLDFFFPTLEKEKFLQDVNSFQEEQIIPLIFINIPVNFSEKDEIFNQGGNDYLTLPWQPKEVLNRIKNQLALQELNQRLKLEVYKRQKIQKSLYASQEKFAKAFRSSPHPMTIKTFGKGYYLEVNDSFVEVFGYSRNEVIGHTSKELNLWVDQQKRKDFHKQLKEQGFISNFEVQLRNKSGDNLTMLLSAEVVDIEGESCILLTSNDITDRKQRENALQMIVEGTSSKTGQEFFQVCVRHLAQLFEVDYAFVTACVDTPSPRLRVLAFWHKDHWTPLFEYNLAGTPCEQVIQGDICCYPEELRSQFPETFNLTPQDIESYIGYPLTNTDHQVIGHLVVMHGHSMNYTAQRKSILQIFAARTEAELERQLAEEQRKARSQLDQLLSHISQHLLNDPLNKAIQFALRSIGELTQCGHVYIFQYSEDGQYWQVLQEWSADRQKQTTARINIKDYPWVHQQLQTQNQPIVQISSLAELPPEAQTDCAALEADNIAAFLVVPLLKQGTVRGYMSIDRFETPRRWNQSEINVFKLVGKLIAIAQSRQDAQEALLENAVREHTLIKIIERMRRTLDIDTIFRTTTEELRHALKCDRVGIYRFNEDWSGFFVAESVAAGWRSLVEDQEQEPALHKKAIDRDRCTINRLKQDNPIEDSYLQENQGGSYQGGLACRSITDIEHSGFEECYLDLLRQFQVKAYVTVPIFTGDHLWGLLAAYQNNAPRQWSESEKSMVIQIGTQLGIALQQAELLAQTQQQSQELKQAKEAADAANRSKSEFLANMSHELRTPLNAILGFTQLMERDTSLNTQQQEHISIINRSGEHLLELINDVLEMSKIEAGRVVLHEESFNLHRLLKSLEEMFQLKAQSKGLLLKFERDRHLPQYVHTDKGKLRQVLINLIGNAIKFTDEGTVTVCVRGHPLRSADFGLYCSVQDTGEGIRSADLDKIFEAFTQSANGLKNKEGTGLGLPISKQFVQLMGGQLQVESQVGKGSKFSFVIPVITPTTLPETITTQTIVGLASGQPTYTMLVVEDNQPNRLLLVNLLKSIGFEVIEAENGQEAIARWESHKPDLIWMDIRMPDIDGYSVTQQIRQQEKEQDLTPPTVIIALTASAFDEDRQKAWDAGCNDFLSKPFQDEELLATIQEHLGVEYLYPDNVNNSSLSSSVVEVPEKLTPESLNVMSEDWKQQVYEAAAQCSDRLIHERIQEIPPEYQPLKTALLELVSEFRFDILIDLLSPNP